MARLDSVIAQARLTKTYGDPTKGNERTESSAKGYAKRMRTIAKKPSQKTTKIKELSIYIGLE